MNRYLTGQRMTLPILRRERIKGRFSFKGEEVYSNLDKRIIELDKS